MSNSIAAGLDDLDDLEQRCGGKTESEGASTTEVGRSGLQSAAARRRSQIARAGTLRLVRGGAVCGGVPSARHGRVELGGAVVDAEAALAWTFRAFDICRVGRPQGREGAALSPGRALENRGIWTFDGLLSTASRRDVEIAIWLVLGEHHGGVKTALATYHDGHASVRTLVDASL